MANGKRGSGGRKRRNQNRRLGFSLSSLASNREKTQSEKNRDAKRRSNKSTSTTTDKSAVGTASSRSFAKNPAGTTVESQLKYFSDPENRRKLDEAVAKFKGTNKKENKNIVSNASVEGGKTKPVSTSTNNNSKTNDSKTNNTSKTNTETKPLKAKTFKEFMAEKGGGQKFEVPDLVSKSKKNLTKSGRRREARIDRRARRRAKDLYNTSDYDQAVKQEKDLIRKRRANRQQFLRNFASQLTTGENAPAQPRDFQGRKEDFYNNQSTAATEGDKAEVEQNTNQFTDLLNTKSNDNSNFNSLLTPQPDPGNFLGTTSISDLYKPGEFAVSPTLKAEEDSTPISAMRKEYNKKRGL